MKLLGRSNQIKFTPLFSTILMKIMLNITIYTMPLSLKI